MSSLAGVERTGGQEESERASQSSALTLQGMPSSTFVCACEVGTLLFLTLDTRSTPQCSQTCAYTCDGALKQQILFEIASLRPRGTEETSFSSRYHLML